jgi:hypothetical protein
MKVKLKNKKNKVGCDCSYHGLTCKEWEAVNSGKVTEVKRIKPSLLEYVDEVKPKVEKTEKEKE